MTDDEIITALECCVTNGECNKCPMSLIRNCMNNLMRNTFVLITRKKAEIELLKKDLMKCKLEKEMTEVNENDRL